MSFLGGKIRYKKDKNFSIFSFLTTCQTTKIWVLVTSTQQVLYLSNL